MKRFLVFILGILAVTAHADEPVRHLDFSHDTERIEGANAFHDPQVGHARPGSLRIAADFIMSKSGNVHCPYWLRIDKPVATLSFWVRSSTVNGFAMQFVDATGQTHQRRFEFKPDGEWHQITITEFAGSEHWHGAGDGTFYPPMRRLKFILADQHVVDGNRGEFWVDDLRIELAN